MDVERTDNFYPIITLTEDVEKIVLMKAALIAITDEHERSFLAVQIFFSVPKDPSIRQTWANAMKRDEKLNPKLSYKSSLWVCEDHFSNRLKAGKRQIEMCSQESNSLELRINAVETKITESLMSNQAAEAEALNTVRENRSLKRKIIALKHDMEQQEKLLQRASETLTAVNKCVKNKKLKELPTVSA